MFAPIPNLHPIAIYVIVSHINVWSLSRHFFDNIVELVTLSGGAYFVTPITNELLSCDYSSLFWQTTLNTPTLDSSGMSHLYTARGVQ